MTFEHLTPEKLMDLQAKVQTLEPMNMKLFNEKLKLIDENYLLTIPLWVTLGGQVISGTFILTEITLIAWFCLKHRKSVNTLLKIGLPLARKIKDNPRIIEQLTQCTADFVTNITPPEPPPRLPLATTDSPTLTSKWSRKESPIIAPLSSIAVPLCYGFLGILHASSVGDRTRCTGDWPRCVRDHLPLYRGPKPRI